MRQVSAWMGRPIAEMDAPSLRAALQHMADLHEDALENYRRHLALVQTARICGVSTVPRGDLDAIYTHGLAAAIGAGLALFGVWCFT